MALGATLLGVSFIGGAGALWWRPKPCACLRADAQGNWFLSEGGDWLAVVPSRVWHGPCWITVVLSAAQATAQAQTTTLTFWRATLAPAAWRILCVLLRSRSARAEPDPASRNTEGT